MNMCLLKWLGSAICNLYELSQHTTMCLKLMRLIQIYTHLYCFTDADKRILKCCYRLF